MTTTSNSTAENVIYRALLESLGEAHDRVSHKIDQALRAHGLLSEGASSEESWEERRMRLRWPTPNHMRRTAGALNIISVARYGDILSHVADLCDGVTAAGVAPQEPELEGWDRLGTESPAELQSWLDKMHRNEPSDREKLIAEATEFIDSWDRLGSWTPDSPIGMVMRLRNALAASLDPEKVAEVERAAAARALEEAASDWAADPDTWGDNEKDYRNELRARAAEYRKAEKK